MRRKQPTRQRTLKRPRTGSDDGLTPRSKQARASLEWTSGSAGFVAKPNLEVESARPISTQQASQQANLPLLSDDIEIAATSCRRARGQPTASLTSTSSHLEASDPRIEQTATTSSGHVKHTLGSDYQRGKVEGSPEENNGQSKAAIVTMATPPDSSLHPMLQGREVEQRDINRLPSYLKSEFHRDPRLRLHNVSILNYLAPLPTEAYQDLTGKFDLWGMQFDFLSDVFAGRARAFSTPKSTRNYDALYDAIVSQSHPNDACSARIYIPPVAVGLPDHPPNPENGSFYSETLAEQINLWGPYKVKLDRLALEPNLKFSEEELRKYFVVEGTGVNVSSLPGLIGQLCLTNPSPCGEVPQKGIKSSNGYIKLRKVWEGGHCASSSRKREIFEGCVVFKVVCHDDSRGPASLSSLEHSFAFWAVRSAT